MPKVKFETGQVVNFETMPTAQDIEEVAQKLGIQKKVEPLKKTFLNKAVDFGKDVLTSLGSTAVRSLVESSPIISAIDPSRQLRQRLPENIKTPIGDIGVRYSSDPKKAVGQGFGDLANIVGGEGAGSVVRKTLQKSVLSPIYQGVKTGVKAGGLQGVGSGFQESKSLQESALQGATGAVVGGALGGTLSAVTPVAIKTLNKIPGFVKAVAQPSKTIGTALKDVGEKIQTTVIKPTTKDRSAGFKIENVTKYDVGGNLGDSLNKTVSKIRDYSRQLNTLIKEKGDQKILSLSNVLDELKSKYENRGLAGLGTQSQTLKTIKEIENELDLIQPNWRNQNISLAEGIQTKRAAGLKAAFEHDPLKSGASSQEQVWNDLYMVLKNKTEGVAPEGLAEVNKALSELIPIEQAIIRRIPVSQRNSVLSLTDMIGLTGSLVDPRALTINVINRILKSGKVANTLSQTGKKLLGR